MEPKMVSLVDIDTLRRQLVNICLAKIARTIFSEDPVKAELQYIQNFWLKNGYPEKSSEKKHSPEEKTAD